MRQPLRVAVMFDEYCSQKALNAAPLHVLLSIGITSLRKIMLNPDQYRVRMDVYYEPQRFSLNNPFCEVCMCGAVFATFLDHGPQYLPPLRMARWISSLNELANGNVHLAHTLLYGTDVKAPKNLPKDRKIPLWSLENPSACFAAWESLCRELTNVNL